MTEQKAFKQIADLTRTLSAGLDILQIKRLSLSRARAWNDITS